MNYIFVAQKDSSAYDRDDPEYFQIHDDLDKDGLINALASCLIYEHFYCGDLINFYIYENGKKIWSERKPIIFDNYVYELFNKAESQAASEIEAIKRRINNENFR